MYNTSVTLADIFKRLGLPKHSDVVYRALEKNGPMYVSALARATRVHRPALYRALSALEGKNLLLLKTFGKRTFYSAGSRAQIDALLPADRAASDALLAERPAHSSMVVRYFEGEKGVTAVFTDVLEHSKRGDTFYRYTSERDLDAVNRLLPGDYRKKRDAKRLERQVISNPESGTRKRSRLERFIKYLGSDKESFRHNAIQLIYGTRIAFIDLNEKRSFIIDNSTLADFQKTIFRALYRRL
jgi:sugar-specific transcriptional regulator TrmB